MLNQSRAGQARTQLPTSPMGPWLRLPLASTAAHQWAGGCPARQRVGYWHRSACFDGQSSAAQPSRSSHFDKATCSNCGFTGLQMSSFISAASQALRLASNVHTAVRAEGMLLLDATARKRCQHDDMLAPRTRKARIGGVVAPHLAAGHHFHDAVQPNLQCGGVHFKQPRMAVCRLESRDGDLVHSQRIGALHANWYANPDAGIGGRLSAATASGRRAGADIPVETREVFGQRLAFSRTGGACRPGKGGGVRTWR